MTIPLYCLLGFAAWTVVLVLAVVSWRGKMVFTEGKAPNDFPSGTPHGPDLYWRLNRAQINAAENLPLFAVVVIVGHLTGLHSGLFATLAQVYLGARLFQSSMHILGNSSLIVNLRFTGLLTQLGCFAAMSWEIVKHAA